MKSLLILIVLPAVFLASAIPSFAQDPKVKPTQVTPWFDTDLTDVAPAGAGTAAQKNPVLVKEDARILLDSLLPIGQVRGGITRAANDVVVIHLVQWKAGAGKNEFGQYKQNWYTFDGDRVYSNSAGTAAKLETPTTLKFSKQEFEGTRIFGKRRFIVLMLYFGANMTYDNFKSWDVEY